MQKGKTNMGAEDLCGKRFGKLTVLRKTEQKRKGSFLWLCECECGNTILLERYKIERGLVQSCGCARKGKNAKDLKGMRIGHLQVVRRLDEKKGSCYLWECVCDCGSTIKVATNDLTKKNPVQSCGCVRQGKDIEGQRFGRLTALYPTAKRLGGSIVWMCRCDCGNVTEVSYNDLRSGNTKSCGCMVHEKGGLPLAYVDDTCVESLKSKTLYKNNTSGCTGVLWQKGRWVAQISFRKCRYYLGSYERLEDAVFVRKKAEHLLHDRFVEQYERWEQNDEGWKREHPLKIVVKGTNIDDFELEVVEQYRGNDEEKGKGKSGRYAVFGTAGERKRPGQT